MSGKSKGLILIQRVLIWVIYFFSGFILYSNQGILPSLIITFSRIIYPLSIFWLQIRIKKRTNFLPIDSKMTTSQLWFNLLPVIASLLTVIFSLTNSILYILGKLIFSQTNKLLFISLRNFSHKKHNVKKFVFYLFLFKF